jgi:hypothetical protein
MLLRGKEPCQPSSTCPVSSRSNSRNPSRSNTGERRTYSQVVVCVPGAVAVESESHEVSARVRISKSLNVPGDFGEVVAELVPAVVEFAERRAR